MQMPCEVCYEDATRVCSACKYTRYCSEACQKANWKTHKKGCEIQQMLNRMNEEHAAAPRARPNPKRCTGCNVRFTEDYPCDGECPDCGYVACESCICDNNNGTCYCPNSNFGNKYCQMEPRYYHTDGNGRGYGGDRHPELFPDEAYPEDFYEPEPRACNNCGEVAKLLKKEYCREIRF
ncbi:uncharacterized protein TRAVEDRAFT_75375 [Trametes versicolor FP-101664 SS1]|uniref:uncharacterized protein n=1 Tax=Trametes versicolor (strain FP-101664) TaxID=717944 RepID=UPI0004622406|nr:uncharacterized protein TRAVEDRAFT_75375 [Trametes versicolor FP-101664 SS1]EIW52396.1 hypothetical protein TRAVEDRAFT_75375 [Trametes versicolor FP-101664 SS1]